MTKENYLEMVEQGLADESEMPPDISEFPYEIQTAIAIFNRCPDTWEYMGGNYTGKNQASIPLLLDIFNVEHNVRDITFEVLSLLDSLKMQHIYEKNKKKSK